MDTAQGEHLQHRGAADRQHSGDPHRGRYRRGLCHRLRRLRAVRLPRAGNRLHPARHGRARHACGRAAARAGARRTRHRRRVRHAAPGLIRQARLLVALCLSRDRHGGGVRPRAYPAVALARGHDHRLRAAMDLPLPAMRRGDDRTPRLPRDRGLRAGGSASGLRLHVRPRRRWRGDRADFLRLARRLSVRRDADRAQQRARGHRDDRLRPADGRKPCRGLARPRRDWRDRRRVGVRLHRVRRMGGAPQCRHAGAARWRDAGH
ncbi:hypothetical protein chiPu_0029883, partial [Chiloscyllium punctatum]|nr:hypothetical protein [Chiloscyllium punctatum]